MKILLTNDDGYSAEGLVTLRRALTAAGHQVWTLAPDTNQSAKSHSVTGEGLLELIDHGDRVFSLTGTPADSVVFFFSSGAFDFLPDLIVSGINRDINIASDVIYSGTCGAASEGALHGIPSVAVSAEMVRTKNPDVEYSPAASFVASRADEFRDEIARRGAGVCYLNVNVPYGADISRSVVCPVGSIRYAGRTERKSVSGNRSKFFTTFADDRVYGIGAGFGEAAPVSEEGYDFDMLKKGYVTMSYVVARPASLP